MLRVALASKLTSVPHCCNQMHRLANISFSAYKFLPVLGRYLADSFELKAGEEMKTRWQIKHSSLASMVCNDGSRRGPPRRQLSKEERARL